MSVRPIEGFEIPLHRVLTESILLGGPPRSVAILNGMMAAALGIGLQLWIAGLALWVVGHAVAVFASKREPQVAAALARHLRQKAYLAC
ncbi:MAG: putative conjugal transfer TrbD transrane protein [Rhodospirillales bacterium]|nr:putative conjugal transfer TrbD transrane protein [Rhodospirillales bacterium]